MSCTCMSGSCLLRISRFFTSRVFTDGRMNHAFVTMTKTCGHALMNSRQLHHQRHLLIPIIMSSLSCTPGCLWPGRCPRGARMQQRRSRDGPSALPPFDPTTRLAAAQQDRHPSWPTASHQQATGLSNLLATASQMPCVKHCIQYRGRESIRLSDRRRVLPSHFSEQQTVPMRLAISCRDKNYC